MPEHGVRNGHARCHKHSRPNNAMKARDIFAHKVVLSWPMFFKLARARAALPIANPRKIGQQSIGPHIGNMPVIKGQRNTPVKGRTTNG